VSYALLAAGPGDAGPCAQILREWIAETDWFKAACPPSSDQHVLEGRIAGGGVIVTSYHGHVAGFLALDAGFVRCLYVARTHRGRGLGRQLLDRAKADRPGGLQLWTFQANAPARRFYEREGFRVAEKTDGSDNEEGLPDIRYVWPAKGIES
jgi:GNAT superfamily N-acetyltransferase